jgi:hypothetical protein
MKNSNKPKPLTAEVVKFPEAKLMVSQDHLIEMKMRWIDYAKIRDYIYKQLLAGAKVEPGLHTAYISKGDAEGFDQQLLCGCLIVK